jgi:hypothetical protein
MLISNPLRRKRVAGIYSTTFTTRPNTYRRLIDGHKFPDFNLRVESHSSLDLGPMCALADAEQRIAETRSA